MLIGILIGLVVGILLSIIFIENITCKHSYKYLDQVTIKNYGKVVAKADLYKCEKCGEYQRKMLFGSRSWFE